jgi:hypothetical protein
MVWTSLRNSVEGLEEISQKRIGNAEFCSTSRKNLQTDKDIWRRERVESEEPSQL